jgi:hypothetical protein
VRVRTLTHDDVTHVIRYKAPEVVRLVPVLAHLQERAAAVAAAVGTDAIATPAAAAATSKKARKKRRDDAGTDDVADDDADDDDTTSRSRARKAIGDASGVLVIVTALVCAIAGQWRGDCLAIANSVGVFCRDI